MQPAARVFRYDQWGNLQKTRTPLGHWTEYHNDALGRTWKTLSPIDNAPGGGVLQQVQEVTFYPNSDRVEYSKTVGPAMNNTVQQTVWVRNTYDSEGNTRSIARWSDPDSSGIGAIITTWVYDAAGRQIVEIAPDATPATLADNPRDSTDYDPAGNAREIHTRRTDPTTGSRLVIRMQHDVLGRLTKRVVPAVRYPSRPGIPINASLLDPAENTTYPRYPTDGSTGYLITADSSLFAYDEMGRDTLADNSDARVRRTYYPNGALKAETQYVRTVTGSDFGKHVYRLEYSYDRNGRRTELRHPSQLAPSSTQNTTRYGYDSITGAPASITDALANVFRFDYTDRGELKTVTRPASVSETYTFDAAGHVKSHGVWNGTLSGYHRSATFQYDIRGKVVRISDGAFSRDTTWATYSGLGHVLNGGIISHGRGNNTSCDGGGFRSHAAEQSRHDALGNLHRHASADTLWSDRGTICGVRGSRINGGYVYTPGTGRLATMEANFRTDLLIYDRAGNNEFFTQSWYDKDRATLQDRASYYAADGTLRAADSRSVVTPSTPQSPRFSFEEYRYDALGRRVWVRARNYCEDYYDKFPAFCNLDKIRRTVWDGTHELYEIQMPGGTNSTYLESDTGPGELQLDNTNNSRAIDPNPFYGRVAYTPGVGVDQPLSVIRIGYGDRLNENGAAVGHRAVAPFAIMPLWDTRGQADRGVYADGLERKCEGSGDALRCVQLNWPGSYFAYSRPEMAIRWWHGTVLEDKRDGAGTHFRRNRYYDSQTGRFTQEDPIGLAGGLNLYGFANGDPVSYSDPYGLCKRDKHGNEDPDCRAVIAALRVAAAFANMAGNENNRFAEAADRYEATRRDVRFVGARERRLNSERQNSDGNPNTYSMGRTMPNSLITGPGDILIGNFLGPGDFVMTAAHEMLAHDDQAVQTDHSSRIDTLNDMLWNQLPGSLTPTAELWRRKLGK